MDNSRCRQFFLEPAETDHRQYEALRAFLVDGRRLQDIAQQFEYPESSLRSLVCRFRNHVKTDTVPPFLCRHESGGRQVAPRRSVRRSPRWPTAAACA